MKWFCQLEGHDFLVEVEDKFIRDAFNLYGLKSKFGTDEEYKSCIKMILSNYTPTSEDLANE